MLLPDAEAVDGDGVVARQREPVAVGPAVLLQELEEADAGRERADGAPSFGNIVRLRAIDLSANGGRAHSTRRGLGWLTLCPAPPRPIPPDAGWPHRHHRRPTGAGAVRWTAPAARTISRGR